MAYEQSLTTITLPANADLSAGQYCFVTTNSTGKVALSAAAANASGILQNNPSAAGQSAAVAIAGISKVVASAAIAIGDNIGCAASGQARTATTGDFVQGTALEAATGANQIIAMEMKTGGKI